ncbi:putative esterase [Gordonia effusa NBRC 100432]|uniref:Putative esterase n=1 Tax=Gordonia effusa NBRC 100432 TaxID=1077974 RepID=H0R5J1_9ACTN|nr:SGNH/GDSL hydrolase family protein [Gordonia effusa]GAB20342.1 putative esterase [Gordonia effusa NBRC 100432]
MPRTTRIVLACVFLVIAAVVVAFVGHSRPSHPTELAAGDTYVAMGSSYAAGPGISPVVDRACLRSGRNYPHQVAQSLDLHLVDVTCSGATTADIISRTQRIRHGRHSLPRQIEAVTSDTRLVTITIGGNDIDYIGRMTSDSCHTAVTAPIPGGEAVGQVAGRTCHTALESERPARRSSTLRQVRNALIKIVQAVHDRAPDAKVFLVQYLPVLGREAATCPIVPLPPQRAAELADEYRRLVAATSSAAARSGATVVDAPTGHLGCDAVPWVTGFQLGNPFAGGAIPYHPNLDGATGQATEVVDAVRAVWSTAKRQGTGRVD